jgi:DNA methyltransferase 1-associated protein 1
MLSNHSWCLPADVKDILGVPRGTAGDDRLQPGVKAKPEKMKRPEGMSREAFALLGGSNPVIPTHLLGELALQPDHCMEGFWS